MKKIILITLIFAAIKLNAAVTLINLTVGDSNIQPEVASAIASASISDTLQFPSGTWQVGAGIYCGKELSLLGYVPKYTAENITTLIWANSMTDAQIQGENAMIWIYGNTKNYKPITISYINFKGREGCITAKDGKSTALDNLLMIYYVRQAVVHHCEFYDSGESGLTIKHWDLAVENLVADCKFINCSKFWDGSGLGYGISVYGEKKRWDTAFVEGSINGVYIERCYFTGCRHAASCNSGSKYIARYSTFINNVKNGVLDAHESPDGNVQPGARYTAWLHNTIINDYCKIRGVANAAARAAAVPYSVGDVYIVQEDDSTTWVSNGLTAGAWTQCTLGNGLLPLKSRSGGPYKSGMTYEYSTSKAFAVRGGQVTIYDNKIQGFFYACFNYENFYNNDATYPYAFTTGWGSQINYNSSHTGMNNGKDEDDCYEWGNTYSVPNVQYCVRSNYVGPEYVKDRDVHEDTPKKNFCELQYPHPLSYLIK